MITKEVNDWIRRVETGNYTNADIMEEFARISRYLTKQEIIQIKRRLESSIKRNS